MEIKKQELLAALRRVMPCVAAADSRVEVFKCVRIHEGRLWTFNGNFGAVTALAASGLDGSPSMGVHASNFAAVLSAMPDEFTLTVEKDQLLCKGGKARAKLPLLAEDQDYPEFLGKDQTELCTAENFYEALESAFFCLDSQSAKYNQAPAVVLRENYLYTTDGKRACRVKLSTPVVRKTVIPMEFARLILKAGKPDFLFEGNGIGVVYGETATLYVGREMKAADYTDRLDSMFDGAKDFAPMPDWSEALKAVETLADATDKAFVECKAGTARFAWEGPRGHVEREADAPANAQSFHCNMKYLGQILDLDPDAVSFCYYPNALCFRKGSDFFHMLALC